MSTGLRAGTNNDGYLQVNGTDVLTALSSGSIGIGTDNPTTKLYAYDNQDGYVSYTFVNASNGTSAVNRIQIGNDASPGSAQLVVYGSQHPTLSNVFDINNANNNDMRLLTNNTERLRITSGGNVGIGVTNPSSKLQVSETAVSGQLVTALKVSNSFYSTFGGPAIDFVPDATNYNYWITGRIGSYYDGVTNWGGGLRFLYNNGTTSSTLSEGMILNTSGNVGIGTTNPGTKLDVFGVIRTSGAGSYISLNDNGYIRGDATGELRFQGGTVGTTFYSAGNSIEFARMTQQGTLVLNPNGSTGAGTLLDIFGGSPSGTRFGAIRIGDGTITGGHVNYWDIGRDNNINGNFTLALNGSEKACVDVSGNVGIGTTNPSTKLDLYRAGSGVAGRFGKETIWGEFQVDGQRIGIQGTRSSDSAITGVYIENPSSSGTSNFNSVSIKTTGYERFRIETDGSQFSSQRYSGANDSYVRRSWRHFQSAFNNPTVDLATFSIGTQNAGIAIYVRVVHIEYYGTAVSPGIISEGLASIRRESTIYTTYAGTMSVIKSATSSNVGTLSWNGQTLQYTPNRVANYDSYYVEFEAFGTLGSAHTITPSW